MSETLMPTGQASRSPRERLATTQMLRTITLIEIVAIAGLAASDALAQVWRTVYAGAPLVVVLLICLWFLNRGNLYPAQITVPLGALLVRDYLAFQGVGLHDVSVVVFAAIILLAYLTLNQALALAFSGLVVVSSSLIGLGEMFGVLVNTYSSTTNLDDVIETAIILISISLLVYIIINRLNENIQRAYRSEQAQVRANQALKEERANLEIRVKERTRDLERRAVQIRAAAEVGNAAASIRDLGDLLNQAVRLLSTRFGFYHTGIFLLDENEEYAVLRASNSEGGQRMLRHGHRLEVGRAGIVGFVAQTGQARIALDVGQDAVFFDNRDLPDTHSEMALPLIVTGKVLGVLDIQSTQPQAFTEEDIETLQVVADQLAVAIDGSRLLTESQAAAEATRRAYGEIAVGAWKQLLEREPNLGFVSNGRETRPIVLAKEDTSSESIEAISQNHPVTSADQIKLFVPIVIRDQSIGVLRLTKPNQERWTQNEIQVIQILSDQLGGSLDAARLYSEAQKRAEKEHVIEEISTRIGASANVETIMQLAVQELGKVIAGSEVVIQLEPSRITADK